MRQLVLIAGLGTVLGCILWLSFGRLGRPTALDEVTAHAPASQEQVSIADALSMPVFAERSNPAPLVIQAPTATPPSELRLLGVSYTPRRRAALVSLGGQSFWLSVGQSHGGVTLSALRRSDADFQVNGLAVHLALFKRPAAPAANPPTDQLPSTGEPPPRGVEPASAPPPAPQPSPPTKAEPSPTKLNNG